MRGEDENACSDKADLATGSAYKSDDAAVVVESEPCESVSNKATEGRLFDFLGSFLGNSSSANSPVELNDMGGRKKIDVVKIVSSADRSGPDAVAGFDVCQEYCYTTDEEDTDVDPPSLITDPSSKDDFPAVMAFLLGKSYRLLQDHSIRRDDESALFWFTYRCGFPEIVPYGLRSDAGWGCMLRSAQMLLGQSLRLHFKSRDWRPPQHCSTRRKDPFIRSILTWFADFASTNQCYYSLHNMVAAGLRYDKLPGEWYGPGTACYVLRDLVEMHERQQDGNKDLLEQQQHHQQQRRIFRVHVASQGTVYKDAIQDLMARESRAKIAEETEKKHRMKPQAHPLDLDWEEELVEAIGTVEWDTALLLLVPVRLGLERFNRDYVEAVAHTFSFPQSVGVLGGRVRGARWFYGAVSDGSKVFALDPHTVQTAPGRRCARINGKMASTVDLGDDYVMSCQCTNYPEVLSLEKMDPSIALGFYCRDQIDLEHLFRLIQEWKDQNPGRPELFSVADASPNYASNVSSAVGDMMSGSSSFVDAENSDDSIASEDDDFIML